MFPTAQVRAFTEVAAAAGFTRAAEAMGVTQPTVSQLVRALEARVGTPLFVRGGRHVVLTAAGRALLPHAEAALRLAADADAAVDRAASAEWARLAVSAGEALATYLLPPAVARIRRRLPRLDASFVVGDEARVLTALRSGEVDAALITERTSAGDLSAADFGRGRMVVIAAASDPDPAAPLRLADLAGRVHVVREPGTINRRAVDRILADAGVEPAGRLEASSLEAVKRCVEAGLGIAVVPEIGVGRELELGVLRELPMRRPVLEYAFRLAWRRGEAMLPAVELLLEELRAGKAGDALPRATRRKSVTQRRAGAGRRRDTRGG
jgi:DNA-binding transcriptional LysR family regulator